MRRELDEVIEASELLVVGLADARTVEVLGQRVRDDQVVLDLANLGDRRPARGTYIGLCW
jgi:GDP-mannose 6-dehydrogenase